MRLSSPGPDISKVRDERRQKMDGLSSMLLSLWGGVQVIPYPACTLSCKPLLTAYRSLVKPAFIDHCLVWTTNPQENLEPVRPALLLYRSFASWVKHAILPAGKTSSRPVMGKEREEWMYNLSHGVTASRLLTSFGKSGVTFLSIARMRRLRGRGIYLL